MIRAPYNESVICRSEDLCEGGKLGFRVLYRGEPVGALLIRIGSVVAAWVNQCVHMARALDSEDDEIFDPDEGVIRCSNHGITYDPVTGACQSALCAGKSLTALRIREHDGRILLVDQHAMLAR
jgi:nitrite reductase/ring-hydroxylating ferredoxin subunit